MSTKTKIMSYFRDPNSTKMERRLVLKLDFFILTFCCLAYFMNYLDRQSLAQAYVSGMKEDLSMYGNQLTVINTVYACGYLIGIVPNNLMLTYFNPRKFFPFMMVVWSGFTMATAGAKRAEDIMAIRFFQGYFESCTFAGTHYLLGSWYTETELGKRSGIFTASGLAGGIFGGLLQAGIYASINGKGGLSGWRWLYIVDGLITLPVAAYGFFLFPDTPRTTTAFYLSAEERALAVTRVPETKPQKIVSASFLKRVVTSWPFYAFCVLWTITNCSEQASTSSLLTLYMKSSPTNKYTVTELNFWPTGVQAVGIVSTLLWATVTDIFGKRWLAGYYIAFTGIVSSIIILVPSTSVAGIFGAYYWAGSIYCCQATFFAWANDELRHESHAYRAVVLGSMNCAGNTFNAFWPLIFYSADQAPYFTRGMYCMIVICTMLALWTTLILFTFRRRDKKVINAVDVTGSEAGSIGAVEDDGQKKAGSVV